MIRSIPYGYIVHGTRRGYPGVGEWYCRGLVEADIPTIVSTSPRFPARPNDRAALHGTVANDRIYLPVHYDGHPVRADALTEISVSLTRNLGKSFDNPAFPIEVVYSWHGVRPPWLAKRFVRNVAQLSGDSDEEQARARAEADISELAFIDGILHTSRYEPVRESPTSTLAWHDVYDLHRRPHAPTVTSLTWNSSRRVGSRAGVGNAEDDVSAYVEAMTAGVTRRYPLDIVNLRLLAERLIGSIGSGDSEAIRIGTGDISDTRMPDSVVEAWFSLRSAARQLPIDLREGRPSDEVVADLLATMTSFVNDALPFAWDGTGRHVMKNSLNDIAALESRLELS